MLWLKKCSLGIKQQLLHQSLQKTCWYLLDFYMDIHTSYNTYIYIVFILQRKKKDKKNPQLPHFLERA
jgi:hypothetical protein